MINENVQHEPATSYDVELAGQLAAIGIVHGKPFDPDERMKKILSDAAAVGQRIRPVPEWRFADTHPDWAYYPGSNWGNMLFEGGALFETPPPAYENGMFKPYPPTGARTLDSRTAFYYAYTSDSPGMIMRIPGVGSQYLMGFLDADGNAFDGAKTYKAILPKDIPARAFWSFTLVRQPVAFDAADAAEVPARGQPELPVARSRGRRGRLDDDLLRAHAARGRGAGQLDPDGPEQGLVHDPAALQPAPVVLRQDMAAQRGRVGEVGPAGGSSRGRRRMGVVGRAPESAVSCQGRP